MNEKNETKQGSLSMRMIAMAAVLLTAAWMPRPADAAGLRTKFGEVQVKGLKIGQTYSLNQLLSLPLRVVNTGEETVDLKIDVIAAATTQLHVGYEVVPDTGWVRLEKREFTVDPSHEAVTDVIIAIPNDPSLLGRKFEADIWSRTISAHNMFGVGMQSRLLIQIASTLPTEDELKKKFVDRKVANLDFTLLPTVGQADGVPVGQEVSLKKFAKVSIKLINPNDQTINFRIRSLPNFEALLQVPGGYMDAYDPKWLKPAHDVVTVEGNSIKETDLLLNVADKPENYGAAFFFPVSVEVLEQEISARVFYKLLVTTAKTKAPVEKK